MEVIIRLCFALNTGCMHHVNIFLCWDSLESAVLFSEVLNHRDVLSSTGSNTDAVLALVLVLVLLLVLVLALALALVLVLVLVLSY